MRTRYLVGKTSVSNAAVHTTEVTDTPEKPPKRAQELSTNRQPKVGPGTETPANALPADAATTSQLNVMADGASAALLRLLCGAGFTQAAPVALHHPATSSLLLAQAHAVGELTSLKYFCWQK